jgi:hypothetical protein
VVIPAYGYLTDTLNVEGIPQNWIVDGCGVVRLKGIGGGGTDKWITDVKEAVEKVKAASVGTAAARSSP